MNKMGEIRRVMEHIQYNPKFNHSYCPNRLFKPPVSALFPNYILFIVIKNIILQRGKYVKWDVLLISTANYKMNERLNI